MTVTGYHTIRVPMLNIEEDFPIKCVSANEARFIYEEIYVRNHYLRDA